MMYLVAIVTITLAGCRNSEPEQTDIVTIAASNDNAETYISTYELGDTMMMLSGYTECPFTVWAVIENAITQRRLSAEQSRHDTCGICIIKVDGVQVLVDRTYNIIPHWDPSGEMTYTERILVKMIRRVIEANVEFVWTPAINDEDPCILELFLEDQERSNLLEDYDTLYRHGRQSFKGSLFVHDRTPIDLGLNFMVDYWVDALVEYNIGQRYVFATAYIGASRSSIGRTIYDNIHFYHSHARIGSFQVGPTMDPTKLLLDIYRVDNLQIVQNRTPTRGDALRIFFTGCYMSPICEESRLECHVCFDIPDGCNICDGPSDS